MSLRRPRPPGRPSEHREPAHRLVRDALEAEELAVEWLRWIGVGDAVRVGGDVALGIVGTDVRADVRFDPLPLERESLERLTTHFRADGASLVVSFTFAGWTPAAFTWAEQHDVALVRFTFAGHLDPSNETARTLARR